MKYKESYHNKWLSSAQIMVMIINATFEYNLFCLSAQILLEDKFAHC